MSDQSIDLLKPDGDNPRDIEAAALAGLGVSMKVYGDLSGLVWNEKTGELVAGHQRMRKLREDGAKAWKRVSKHEGLIVHPSTGERFPIRIVSWDRVKQRMANLVANNPELQCTYTAEALVQLRSLEKEQEYRELRLDALLETLEEDLKTATGTAGGNTDPDEVPEPPKVPVTKPGDLWILGEHRLLCGDSTKAEDVARVMGGGKADAVFTSPPYGVGVDYGKDGYKDTIANLRAMLPLLAKRWKEAVVPGGFAVVNFNDIAAGRIVAGVDEPCEYPMTVEYWPVFRGAGWLLWSRRVWCKPNARVNSLWAISSNRAAADWEHIWTWKRPGAAAIVGRVNGDFQSANGWVDSTFGDGVGVGKEAHGAGMPAVVARRWIAMHSRPKHIVLEPFTGTGTTMLACEQLGRRCYGGEISPAYCDVAVTRWEAFTGRKAERQFAAKHIPATPRKRKQAALSR